jgi:signal peptidase
MTATAAPRPRRTPAGVLGDVLLWIAAIGGVLCILGVIATFALHVNLIMFKTGSMSPTIPAGSLAVVHEIPASEIRVGDVVTVDRVGELPVTHRVTSVAGSGDTRTITLRGDANPTDDAAPYVVSTVRIVWLSIPGWASVVVWFSNPLVLGGLTLGATALVTWAFWPRDERHGRRRASRGSRALAAGGTALGLAVVLAAATPAGPAQAAETETIVSGTYLTLTSVIDPVLASDMGTGDPVPWQVGVDANPPDAGTLHLGIAAVAPLPAPGDFSLGVRTCTERWVAGTCAGISGEPLPATDLTTAIIPTASNGAREFAAIPARPDGTELWVLVTVTRTTATQPQPAQLRLWVWGASSGSVGGETTGEDGLAFTGSTGWFPPMLLAGLAIAAGLLIAVAARRRSEVADD